MKMTKADEKMMDFGLEKAFLELRGIIRDPSKLVDIRADVIKDGKRKTYFVKVTAGGRVTVPAPFRRELGMNDDFVTIELVGETIILRIIEPLNEWYRAYFGPEALKKGVSWEAAEKALARAGPKIMDELYGGRQGGEGRSDGEREHSKEMVSKESLRCPCGCRTKPRMFRIKGFDIRGSECPKCGEGFLNGGDADRYLMFNKLRHWVLKKIDPDYGLELSAETKRDLARSRAEIKAGKVRTLEEVKKQLGL
jgi:bifunctional DNA-binding transcriptional regulator/antitoxin component of YhaV-PrlF toxin-antitoxin module